MLRRLVILAAVLLTFTAVHAAGELEGQFFLPVSARVIDDVGFGTGLGWQSRSTGFIVMGEITWDRLDGSRGVVTYDPDTALSEHHNWPAVPVRYAAPDRTEVGFTFTLGIPLGRTGHGRR